MQSGGGGGGGQEVNYDSGPLYFKNFVEFCRIYKSRLNDDAKKCTGLSAY